MVGLKRDGLIAALRVHGLRITGARAAICEAVAASPGEHFDAGSILDAVRAAGAPVDQSTVYRTLDLLEELGLIFHSHLGTGTAVYHLGDEAPHHHVVCHECGQTAAIDAADLGEWVASIRSRTGFVVDARHVAVTGRCAACARLADRGRSA